MAGRRAKLVSNHALRRALSFASKTATPERDRTMILLSVRAGLRACEIAGLDWTMVLDPAHMNPPEALEIERYRRWVRRHAAKLRPFGKVFGIGGLGVRGAWAPTLTGHPCDIVIRLVIGVKTTDRARMIREIVTSFVGQGSRRCELQEITTTGQLRSVVNQIADGRWYEALRIRVANRGD